MMKLTQIFAATLATTIAFVVPVSAEATRRIESGEELDGFLEPNQIVKIASQVPGVIDTIRVNRGDVVRKGDVIATLKSGVEKTSVDYFRAKVDFGVRRSGRNAELAQKQLISTHEKDELDTDIVLSKVQLAEALEKLHMRTIISPIDGVVTKRSHNAGEIVGEDDVITVARLDPLNVEVIVPVSRLGTITKGTVAEVTPEAPVGGSYQATVVIVDRTLDAASGTFGVRLELPNPGLKLPSGLKCKVKFQKP